MCEFISILRTFYWKEVEGKTGLNRLQNIDTFLPRPKNYGLWWKTGRGVIWVEKRWSKWRECIFVQKKSDCKMREWKQLSCDSKILTSLSWSWWFSLNPWYTLYVCLSVKRRQSEETWLAHWAEINFQSLEKNPESFLEIFKGS